MELVSGLTLILMLKVFYFANLGCCVNDVVRLNVVVIYSKSFELLRHFSYFIQWEELEDAAAE